MHVHVGLSPGNVEPHVVGVEHFERENNETNEWGIGASPLSSERRGDAELFSMFVIVTAFVILFFAWAMKIAAMIA